MYIFKKNVLLIYQIFILMFNINFVYTCKYLLNTCMCVYLHIQNNYTHHTHIYYVNTNFYFGCDLIVINRFTALRKKMI